MPHVVSLLFVLLILSKLDDDKFSATFSNMDVIKGAFSSKRGDIKGEQDEPRFVDLSSVSDTVSLFFVVEHSGTSGGIKEVHELAEPELLTGKICFGGLDFRADFLLRRRKFVSRSDSKQGRQLLSLILCIVPSGGGDSSIQ